MFNSTYSRKFRRKDKSRNTLVNCMRKGLFGNYVITEDEKKDLESVEDLENQIKDKNKIITDRDNSIKKLQNEKKELESTITGLNVSIKNLNESYENEKDKRMSLKSKIDEIKQENNLKMEELKKSKDSEIEKLIKEKKEFASRCGGYQKEKNKNIREIESLKEEIKQANEKISNFQTQLKANHVPVSPRQYDNKIVTVAQHKKKMNNMEGR